MREISGSLAALLGAEPVGHQGHHRDVGKTAADADQGVEAENRAIAPALADTEHADADQQQSCGDGGAGMKAAEQGRCRDARMFRYPAVSADRIAFVYAGDIWLVARDGGAAVRI